MFNKFKCLVLVIVIMFSMLIVPSTTKALPSSVSGIDHSELISFDGGINLYHKTYSNGVAFCTTFLIQGVGSSCTLSSNQWSVPAASGIAAIIEKYNAQPSVKNYYYAELAINRFLYDYETKNSINDIVSVDGAKAFYNVAVNAYNEAKKDYNIGLSADKLSFELSGGNYISNKITVSGSDNYTIKVSGIEGSTYEQNGNEFYIKVPETSVKVDETAKVNVTVSGNKTISIAKSYECGSGNQNLTINDVEKTNKSSDKTISGEITKKTTKLKISKQDLTSKKELKGATLVLKNSKGEEVDRWVSEDTAHYIEGLEPGTYTLTETIAPEGYKLSEEKIEFELKASGKVTEVVMYNVLKDKYKVKISKQDITTKTELPGATLVLKNSKGEEIDRWVSGNTPHYLELDAGVYTLVEIQAPNGYDLSYEVIKFTVGESGEVETEVVMYNSKTPDTADRNILLLVSIMTIGALGVGLSIYKLKHQ